jgi:hypothetical protein
MNRRERALLFGFLAGFFLLATRFTTPSPPPSRLPTKWDTLYYIVHLLR